MAASTSKKSFSDLVGILSNSELPVKSVLQDGFLKKPSLPPYVVNKRALQRQRRKEREKTKGSGWYNMPAPEMTEERKNDLTVLKMRSVLDPKRFYKKNEKTVLPKYFQMGTVVETAAEFYSSRIPKKQRKRTIVEELLADGDFKRHRARHVEKTVLPRQRHKKSKNKRDNKNKNKSKQKGKNKRLNT